MNLIVNLPQHHSRVSFATYNKVTIVENLAHEHNTNLWYTASKLKSFKCDATLFIASIHSSGMMVAQYAKSHVDKTSGFLSIENYLSEDTIREVVRRRHAIVDAVLLEQERQYHSGNIDADIMAVVLEAISGLSARRARLIVRLHSK